LAIWVLAPGLAVEKATVGLGRATAPLLEEEGHLLLGALVADAAHPAGIDRPGTWPALAADDDPADPAQVDLDRSEQRLDREEAHGRGHSPKMFDAKCVALALDRYAHPDVRGPRQLACEG